MIPVCEPVTTEKEKEYVLDCLETNWLSSAGKYLNLFEEGFSSYCGVGHGIGVCNGTTALHLAIAALQIQEGDEVIMPTFTIASCAFAILYNKGIPVLVDSDRETWCIDTDKIEEKITKKTRAIMVVHMYGHPVNMQPVYDLAKKYNLFIIEDAAEAHGGEYDGKKTGGLGDISCFSFYANKIISTGEGGMVLTNNDDLAERCRSLKNLAFSKETRFLHHEIGYNYRMTNLQAAIGTAQLEHVDDYAGKRRANAKLYSNRLKDFEMLTLPVEKPWAKNVYWMYSLLIAKESGFSRDDFRAKLHEKGVDTRSFFIPMHRQPFMKPYIKGDEKFEVSDYISETGFYLPSGTGLTEEQISFVCDQVQVILEA